jgi:hypothetical protein
MDPNICWQIDSAMEYIEDVFSETGKSIIGSWFSCKGINEAAQVDYIKRLDKTSAFVERRLTGHGKRFLAGTDSVTIADCKLANIYFGTIYNDYFCCTPE